MLDFETLQNDRENGAKQPWKAGLSDYLRIHYRPAVLEQPAMTPQMAKCASMPRIPPQKKHGSVFSGLRERLQKTDAGFSETLLNLIDRSGKKDSEIYTRANVSRQHFS